MFSYFQIPDIFKINFTVKAVQKPAHFPVMCWECTRTYIPALDSLRIILKYVVGNCIFANRSRTVRDSSGRKNLALTRTTHAYCTFRVLPR
jgi:hypothetical protein